MGKGWGWEGVPGDRRGQKIENKTDRQIVWVWFFGRGRGVGGAAPAGDITFSPQREHSDVCRPSALPTVIQQSFGVLTATPALPQRNASFNGEKMRISHWTDKWEGSCSFLSRLTIYALGFV